MLKRTAPITLGGAFVLALTFGGTAFAGKPERDKIDELKPKIAEVEKTVKSLCGCSVKISVNWDSYKTADDMFRIANTLEALESAVKEHCQKPADKKALCDNLTTVEILYAKDGGFAELKGKTIRCGSNDSSYTGDHQFKQILDKF